MLGPDLPPRLVLRPVRLSTGIEWTVSGRWLAGFGVPCVRLAEVWRTLKLQRITEGLETFDTDLTTSTATVLSGKTSELNELDR